MIKGKVELAYTDALPIIHNELIGVLPNFKCYKILHAVVTKHNLLNVVKSKESVTKFVNTVLPEMPKEELDTIMDIIYQRCFDNVDEVKQFEQALFFNLERLHSTGTKALIDKLEGHSLHVICRILQIMGMPSFEEDV